MEDTATGGGSAARAVLWLAVIIIIAGLGFAWSKQVQSGKVQDVPQIAESNTDYFARNQECLKYTDEIAAKLEAKDAGFGEATLEQIFYSPKVNSCLYVEFSELSDANNPGNSFQMKRLFDVRDDGYSSTPLGGCESYREGFKIVKDPLLKSCVDFEDRIADYAK